MNNIKLYSTIPMVDTNLPFDAAISQFCDAASWLIEQISSSNSLKEDDLAAINDKLDALYPVAEKCDSLSRTSKVQVPEVLNVRLENVSSSLWNALCIAIKIEKREKLEELLCYSRLFSSILFSIHEAFNPSNGRKLRILTCYTTTFKMVVDRKWEKISQLTYDGLKRNLSFLEEIVNSFTEIEAIEFKKLKVGFCLLNFQNSLKTAQIEIAKQYESEADIMSNIKILDPTSLLEACRIIYNASLVLNENSPKHNKDIIYFLTKANQYLELNLPDLKTHVDYNNIRYCILLLLTSSLMNENEDVWDFSNCEMHLKKLQDEYPMKLEPFVLCINFTKKRDSTNVAEETEEIIKRMIRSIDVISNFEGINGIINEFAATNTKRAVACLDFMFMNKLDPEKNHKWLEKILVFRFFLTSQSKDMTNVEIIDSLERYCDHAEKRLMDTISKHTMCSVITLLWNSGKKSEKAGQYMESIGFYRIALRSLVSQTYCDRGKIQRALMFTYIKVGNFDQCQELYEHMSAIDVESPLTQLLMLQNFIKQSDEDSCLGCLKKIKLSESENAMDTLVLAVAECRASKILAIKAMSTLFDALESKQISDQKLTSFSLPMLCLLRYTLQLIMKLAEDDQQDVFTHYLLTMRTLLQRAVEYLHRIKILRRLGGDVEKDPRLQEVTSVDEIEWFASTSYNVALKCFGENVDGANILEFTQLSRQFIQLIPYQDFTFPKAFYYTYWSWRSQSLHLTIMHTTEAGENTEALRKIQTESSNLITEILQSEQDQEFKHACGPEETRMLDECFIDALTLNYEISLKLRDQTKISGILTMTAPMRNPRIETVLFDLASSMYELPRGLFIEIIEKLIERGMGNTHLEDNKICYWLRCFLDCALTLEQNSRLDLTQHILRRMQTNFNLDTPESDQLRQEIEMIATLCWNQGVNSIIKEKKTLGTEWCHTSIKFANIVSSSLESQLQELWSSLSTSAQL